MISRFFIDRPIFAAVLSIVIALAGAICVFTLPLAQFPQVTPPTVQVTCTYPGANAKEVADSVAAPIEQQVNGVEGMMYMSSQSANDGSYNLTVTFHQGIDLNMAQVLVQNRVSLAIPNLPEVIKATGVTTLKRSPDILMGIAIQSDGHYDQVYLSNFALMQVKDELVRIEGVGDVFLFGQRDNSMRIWLNPDQMYGRGISATDVVNAIREQNRAVAVGAIGQEPTSGRQPTQVTLTTLGRLAAIEEFGNIIVKTGSRGQVVRLKDVAQVKLGAKNEDVSVRLDGNETVFLAIFQRPDANALDTRQRIIDKMEGLKKNFPPGVSYDVGFDTTPYTSESIREVFKTLVDAIVLVAVVVLLFLQNWRSAIIPLVAVPVAIIGTFAVMAAFGFSLNNLTLFGLVLAIGIVVDDAIVVVEAVEHHIEHGLPPREATILAMKQVSGPVIAVGLVLSAVFVPCAFISGITGMFFRQFALTIAVSTLISAFNSLTLSPALTAVLLRPRDKETAPPLPRLAFAIAGGWLGWTYLTPWIERGVGLLPASAANWAQAAPAWCWIAVAAAVGVIGGWLVGRPINWALRGFFRLFNSGFKKTTTGYVWAVGGVLRISVLVLLIYGGLLLLTWKRFQDTPKGFIPGQDMGYLMVNVQLPDSASAERCHRVMHQVEQIGLSIPGVKHVSGIAGMSFVLNAFGSNFGSLFVNLHPYPMRRDPSMSSEAIAAQLRARFAREVFDAQVAVFGPPPVRGVGRSGGFSIMIEDRGDYGPHRLQKEIEKLVAQGNTLPGFVSIFSVYRANVPQIHIDADPAACMMRGVSMFDFARTLEAFEGSLYVNDFNLFGRTWQVIVQAQAPYRTQPEHVVGPRTRNSRGAMVPVGSLAQQRAITGPLVLTRYNMYPAAAINGGVLPGMSSGQVIDVMARLARSELPPGMAYEWTDMSYLELLAGNTAMMIFAFAVVMVFLVLAAQYESWSLPLAVILVVPMCLLCSIIGVNIADMDINIFTQIGFVVLVGLTSKNAILIVEFAKMLRHQGKERREATLEACKLRLRPIVMTSLAFVLGVVPLIVSHGAGAEMRKALGVAVFSGMLGVTIFGLFLTPVFFNVIDWLGESRLFHSRLARHLGFFALELFTLRSMRHSVARRFYLPRYRRAVVVPPPSPATNGHSDHKDHTEPDRLAEYK